MEYSFDEVLISSEKIAERVSALGAEISEKYKGKDLCVIGILCGAVVFMADLVRCISPSVNLSMEFIKASSYGASTQSSGDVKLAHPMALDVKNRHVLIVEDIVDSGNTLKKLREYFAAQGAASVEVCALLNKKERRTTDVKIEYSGFDIPDVFVVGYGMDYDEHLRNLPSVHVLHFAKQQ
ncbi:MAG: hypoxanthine phosphoribosyltransferase [Pyramidobacter sp.]|jgi:hypoxanthine phosphoribosyltransferase